MELIPPKAFRLPPDAMLRAHFGHVTTWVFDLDNTLCPPARGIWQMVHERITLFLFDLFGIDWQSAQALHEHYYSGHGATLLGLAVGHNDQIEQFLEFVHDIDRSALKPDPILAREVERLPGRKLIFTNGSRNHAILTARHSASMGFSRTLRHCRGGPEVKAG